MLQRKAVNYDEVFGTPPIVQEVLNSPGQPLDQATRDFYEPRFGHDFSQVRVHTDSKAAESARAVNALAYTVGKEIAFIEGSYVPNRTNSQRLLAHELTHIVQQSTAPTLKSTNIKMESDCSPRERQANKASESINIEVAAIPDNTSWNYTGGEQKLQRQDASAIMQGGALLALGVSQVDSPLPGPADLVALGILAGTALIAGGVWAYQNFMSQHGRGNQADTGIMQEVHDLIAAGRAATVCAALSLLMQAAETACDSGRIQRIKRTQKANGCRHSRGD